MKKPTMAETVGQTIRARRHATGMSQDDFADRINMHRAYYSSIERGEKNITLKTLQRVADGLGTSMASLLEGVD